MILGGGKGEFLDWTRLLPGILGGGNLCAFGDEIT